MVLPVHPNPISLSQIQGEFGGSNPISLSEYYSGKTYVPSGTVGHPNGGNVVIPSSGTISLGNFHGAVKKLFVNITSSGTLVIPAGYTRFTGFLVGGGGAGGYGDDAPRHGRGGGGGAGGLVILNNVVVVPGSRSVVIGDGGIGGSYSTRYNPGSPSSFNTGSTTYTAYGGGAGGGQSPYPYYDYQRGQDGASGGGASGTLRDPTTSLPGGAGRSGQGRDGAGTPISGQDAGGGGGGYAAAATNKNGGAGYRIQIPEFGFDRYVCGGGGGAAWSGGGGAGWQTAGNGAGDYGVGGHATANSGSGGGGGGEGYRGGNGGSGLLVGVLT